MYAGIKSLSPDIREAAKIDGANDHQLSRYITIPMIKPVLRMCVIFAVTGSLKAFDLIYVLTGGGPAHASEVPSTLMINMIFDRSRYGLGSSIAMFIIFPVLLFRNTDQTLFSNGGGLNEKSKNQCNVHFTVSLGIGKPISAVLDVYLLPKDK